MTDRENRKYDPASSKARSGHYLSFSRSVTLA